MASLAAGHFCRLSSGHVTESHDLRTWDDIIHVTLLSTAHAHQRPINLLQTEGGRVVSGGQDHTLKVTLKPVFSHVARIRLSVNLAPCEPRVDVEAGRRKQRERAA